MTWPQATVACAFLMAVGQALLELVRLHFAGLTRARDLRMTELESAIRNLKDVVTTNAVALKRLQDRETAQAMKGLKL